jgi:hypothetical protein
MSDDPNSIVTDYCRGLFSRLEEFFIRATGQSASEFATVDTFREMIRTRAADIAPRCEAAFDWLDTEVRSWVAEHGIKAFSAARQLGGMKLILGGSSRFLGSQLSSATTAAMYSDTVLIPDPVMPWLERYRTEERFQHVLVLQATHTLLHLKPLVDADLPYPAIVVFPSYEKLLEGHDQETQEGISRLVADVCAHHLGEPLSSLEEVRDYSNRHPDRFCRTVDHSHLFVAPGGNAHAPLVDALELYKTEMQTWRSQEWNAQFQELPQHLQILNGISERFSPFYHFLENAKEFSGDPLICIEQHAHYFRLLSETWNARLEAMGVLQSKTKLLINSVGSRRLKWLGGIPMETVVALRVEKDNEVFRQRLSQAIDRLHGAQFQDLERVTAEVCHEIDSMVGDHDSELRRIRTKYARIHGETAVLAIGAAGAALIPALAPFLGSAVPFALAAKYGHDKVAELAEKRTLTRSLIGVLAAAREGGKE